MNGFQTKQIQRAQENPEKLTDWEYDFINSLAEMDEDQELSKKQNHILNRIAEKVG